MAKKKKINKKNSNDPMHKTINEWLKTHSPTELLDPRVQPTRKRKANKNNFSQYPIIPNKSDIKIYKGGGCSPK